MVMSSVGIGVVLTGFLALGMVVWYISVAQKGVDMSRRRVLDKERRVNGKLKEDTHQQVLRRIHAEQHREMDSVRAADDYAASLRRNGRRHTSHL